MLPETTVRGWDDVLTRAVGLVSVIRSATPLNWSTEVARLVATWQRGAPEAPRFAYAPAASIDEGLLDALQGVVDAGEASRNDLGAAYAARAVELLLEARIQAEVGSPRFRELCTERYAARADEASQAAALANTWFAVEPMDVSGRVLSDDAGNPGSLLSLMRAEIGQQRLPFRVIVQEQAALASTGDGVVLVAPGRRVTEVAARRTVLHEVYGHVWPQVRAKAEVCALFRIGTARGSDDQEGVALCLEHDAGYLKGLRCRELAMRHLACEAMQAGAGFVEVVGVLQERAGELEQSIRVASRVFRGGGLGRERAYLPAYLRVQALQRTDPTQFAFLQRGRVAAAWAGALMTTTVSPAKSKIRADA